MIEFARNWKSVCVIKDIHIKDMQFYDLIIIFHSIKRLYEYVLRVGEANDYEYEYLYYIHSDSVFKIKWYKLNI